MKSPIDEVIWMPCNELVANEYNPNVVFNKELELLKFSLLKTGWIQPILASLSNVIIDGFHRFWLSSNDKDMINKFNYKVPVCLLDLNEPERMLLTVRINRAKGSHVALRMHDLVSTVYNEFDYTKIEIAHQIGANIDEVELLLIENVFQKLDIKKHKYSKAWIPEKP